MGKMKTLQLFLLGYIAFLLPLAACGQSPAAYHTVREPQWRQSLALPEDSGGEHRAFTGDEFPGAPNGFYLYLPAGWEAAEQDYPLLIFLHGWNSAGDSSGKSAADQERLKLVLRLGIPRLIEEGRWNPPVPFIVFSPQGRHRDGWEAWEGFTERLSGHFPIDRSRQYLTGISFGGAGTWNWLGRGGAGTEIAAAAPVCSFLLPEDYRRYTGEQGAGFWHVPVWAFHGAQDKVVPPSAALRLISKVRRENPELPARLTIFTELAHHSWPPAYEGNYSAPTDPEWNSFDTDVFAWMLQFRRVRR
jgi:predicted peptidase